MPCAGRRAEQSKFSTENYVCISREAILMNFMSIIHLSFIFDKYFATAKSLHNVVYMIRYKHVNPVRGRSPQGDRSTRLLARAASNGVKKIMQKKDISKKILKKLGKKPAVVFDELIKDDLEQKYAVTRALKNMASGGLVECLNSDNNKYFRLTLSGKQKFNNIALECESTLVSTKWDGFWRIIILDLPEERKNERDALRYLLKKAGFICVKNSVWVSMLPYENLFINIKNDLGLSTEIMIIVTDKLDPQTQAEFLSEIAKD